MCDKTIYWLLPVYALFLLIGSDGVRAEDWLYTIRSGDNLWNVAERHLVSMKYVPRLQQLNRIQDPHHIPPGKVIRIPVEWATRRPGDAEIVDCYGTATLRRTASAEILPITEKLRVAIGDEISTGPDSQVTLEFRDRSRLRVESESKIRLKQAEVLGQDGVVMTEVELESGRTVNIAPHGSEPATRFRIRTPAAVSSVRGTRFRVGADKQDGTTRSEVLEGLLEVSAQGRNVQVREGYGTVTRPDQSPVSPVELLPGPDFSATPDLYERVPLIISLKPLAGARSYRVQIALDPEFRQISTDLVAMNLPLRGRELADGDYWLRVRGQDVSGLEGKDGVKKIRVHARPEPPFIMAPQSGARVGDNRPVFEWATRPDIKRYLIEVDRTADFRESRKYESDSPEGYFMLSEPLTPGEYWWRIAAESEIIGVGPYSDSVSFKVPVPGPELDSVEIEREEIRFAWSAGETGEQFQFQMARDSGFDNIISDVLVSEPRVVIPNSGGGRYYLRIKPIRADGEEGVFGPVQSFEIPYRFPFFLPFLGFM